MPNSALVSDVGAAALRAFYNAPQREHSASLASYRSATTTGLLDVMAQDIEEGLAARKAGA